MIASMARARARRFSWGRISTACRPRSRFASKIAADGVGDQAVIAAQRPAAIAAERPFGCQTMFAEHRYCRPGLKRPGSFGMGVIVIRCPQTGREIPTGIEMDAAEFRRAPVFFSRVQCPVCAREHE